MCSDGDDPIGPGSPIRISADQRSLASPRGFSQRATSFIASWCRGIHQMPLGACSQDLAQVQAPPKTPLSIDTFASAHRSDDRRRTTDGRCRPRPTPPPPSTLRHEDLMEQRAPDKGGQGRQSRRHGHVLHNVNQPDDRGWKTGDRTAASPSAVTNFFARCHPAATPMPDILLSSIVRPPVGGGERIRTADPLLAKQVLSQLSYAPRSQEAKPTSLRFPDSGFWFLASVRRDAQTAARSRPDVSHRRQRLPASGICP